MNIERGITLVALVVTIIVMLIITGITLSITTNENTKGVKEMTETSVQENCNHEWVITSKYDWFYKSYKTISKCSKCEKEI